MVHRLLDTTQIEIHDKNGPCRLRLDAKKPFSKIRQVDCSDQGPTFLVFDRYRFEVVQVPLQKESGPRRTASRMRSRSLRRENSLTPQGQPLPQKQKTGLEQLTALRKAGKIIHCTFQESSQTLALLAADKTVALFDFADETLKTGLNPPRLISDQTKEVMGQLNARAGSLANKLSGGSKLHQLIESTASLDFNIYPAITTATNLRAPNEPHMFVLQSGKLGQQLLVAGSASASNSKVQLASPESLASQFVVNKPLALNVTVEVKLEGVSLKSKTATVGYRCLVFQLESSTQLSSQVPIVVREEKASFKVPLGSKEVAQAIAVAKKQKVDVSRLIKARVETDSDSMVSVVAFQVGMDLHQCFMIDLLKKQTVIDLSARMHGDIPSLHKLPNQALRDLQWVTVQGQRVILASLDSGLVCFDQDGQQVKLLSDAIYGQNIIGNFSHFAEGAKLQFGDSKRLWALGENCLTLFDGTSFQSFKTSFRTCPFQKPIQPIGDLRRCDRIGSGFPLLTVSGDVVIDSRLSERNERVFMHWLWAVKLHRVGQKSDLGLYRAIFQGFNTTVYFLRSQQYMLAFQTLLLLKTEVMSDVKKSCRFETQPFSGRAFSQAHARSVGRVKVLKEGAIFDYGKLEGEASNDKVDKSPLLRQLAGFMVMKLVQVFNQRRRAIALKNAAQNGDLLPLQIAYEQSTLTQLQSLILQTMRTFFGGREQDISKARKSLALRYSVAQALSKLRTAQDKKALSNSKQLVTLRKAALGRVPFELGPDPENDRNLGKVIMLQIIQPQRLESLSSFRQAVDLFKAHGLLATANEFLLILQLLRQVQLCLKTCKPSSNERALCRVMLPSALEVLTKLKGNEIVDLADLRQSAQVRAMSRLDVLRYRRDTLTKSFDLFFGDSGTLLKKSMQVKSYDELLLLASFVSEVRNTAQPVAANYFRKLVSIYKHSNLYSVNCSLVTLRHILDSSPGMIEPESDAFQDIRQSIFAQRLGQQKTILYPRLVTFVLRNVNKLSLKDFKALKLASLALDPTHASLNELLFDSFATLCATFKCDFQINHNALINAPTIKQGILEAMTLKTALYKTQLQTSKKIELQNARIDASKEAIWQLVLWLWALQCQLMSSIKAASPLTAGQASAWRIRALSVMRTLHQDSTIDTRQLAHIMQRSQLSKLDSLDESQPMDSEDESYREKSRADLTQVQQIYLDQHQMLQPIELVSRALTDSHFSRFLHKLPSIFTHYSNKSRQKSLNFEAKVQRRIRDLYWASYCDFKDCFGLKLNYSLKYEKGINLVQLVKRRDRLGIRPKADEPSDENGLTIAQLDQEELSREQVQVSDDLLNQTMTSQGSALNISQLKAQPQPTLNFQNNTVELNQDVDYSQPSNLGQSQDLSLIEHLNDYTIGGDKKALLDDFERQIDSQEAQSQHKKAELDDSRLERRVGDRQAQPDSPSAIVQQQKEVKITQDYGTQVVMSTNFQQTDINFLSKQGRVLSPLEQEGELVGNDHDSLGLLDQSSADQLQALKLQMTTLGQRQADESAERRLRQLKKGIRLLEKVAWKKQTSLKFASMYQIKAWVESRSHAEQIAQLKQLSIEGSQKDDSTSMGQQTTTGALSTLPSGNRGRGGRNSHLTATHEQFATDITQREELSPETMANTATSGWQNQSKGRGRASHTQRMRGQSSSPQFYQNAGRKSELNQDNSSLSRGDDYDETDDLFGKPNSQFKTITLREDDEFYKAYVNRGRGSPLGFNQDQSQLNMQRFGADTGGRRPQKQRFEAYSTGRKDGPATSRFDDSRSNFYAGTSEAEEASSAISAGGYDPSEKSVFDGALARRNRFLDLHLFVDELRSRLVRTPDQETRRARYIRQKKQTPKKRSHSPFGLELVSKNPSKAEKHASVLDKIKLMRVYHPNQQKQQKQAIQRVSVSPMRHRTDVLLLNNHSHQAPGQRRKPGVQYVGHYPAYEVSQLANANQFAGVGQTMNTRKARFLHFKPKPRATY